MKTKFLAWGIATVIILVAIAWGYSKYVLGDIVNMIHSIAHSQDKKIDLVKAQTDLSRLSIPDRLKFRKYLKAKQSKDDQLTEVLFNDLDERGIFKSISFGDDLDAIIRITPKAK